MILVTQFSKLTHMVPRFPAPEEEADLLRSAAAPFTTAWLRSGQTPAIRIGKVW